MNNFWKGKAKVLSSDKVLGDPGNWKVIRDNNIKMKVTPDQTLAIENKFSALEEGERSSVEKGSNQITELDNTMEPTSSTRNEKIMQQSSVYAKRQPHQGTSHIKKEQNTKAWIEKSFGEVLLAADSVKKVLLSPKSTNSTTEDQKTSGGVKPTKTKTKECKLSTPTAAVIMPLHFLLVKILQLLFIVPSNFLCSGQSMNRSWKW